MSNTQSLCLVTKLRFAGATLRANIAPREEERNTYAIAHVDVLLDPNEY